MSQAATGTCDSCGRDDEELSSVRRRYVTPESWDTPGTDVVVDDVERWCVPCMTHYPHLPA
jgi:hypothetical protein